MKYYLSAAVALALFASSSMAAQFKGTVTAVDSNDNVRGYSFTAVCSEGKVKIFKIDNLAHLDLRDRVVVTYSKADKFPIRANTVKFLPPVK
jgi:hypothetical protein